MRAAGLGIVVMWLAAAAAPAVAQSVRSGVDAWRQGNAAEAVAIWRPLAEKGDADAAFNLGQAYRLGRGVATDLAAARTWLLKAASKDHVDAQTTLGLLLFDSGDRAGALRWLKSAAERGEPRALLVYGTALFNGDGVTRDPVLAYAYVSRAAAQGLAPAKATLADMDRLIPLEQRRKGVALAVVQAQGMGGRTQPEARAKTAPPPGQAAERGAGWRIQLGAFSQKSSADALFRRLSNKPPVAGKRPFLIAAGSITRLQAGPYPSRAAAAAACSALLGQGQPCFPVRGQ